MRLMIFGVREKGRNSSEEKLVGKLEQASWSLESQTSW